MKITLSGTHNGVTKEICTYEYNPAALNTLNENLAKEVTTEVQKVIMGEIEHYMKQELKND